MIAACICIHSGDDAAGFSVRRLYGSFERQPFDPLESRDLIVVAS